MSHYLTVEDVERIQAVKPLDDRVFAYQLVDRTERTLIYGYTCDRNTFMVKLDGGSLWVCNEDEDEEWVTNSDGGLDPWECVPNKRVYPESCDYEFCMLLRKCGVDIPFTRHKDWAR